MLVFSVTFLNLRIYFHVHCKAADVETLEIEDFLTAIVYDLHLVYKTNCFSQKLQNEKPKRMRNKVD